MKSWEQEFNARQLPTENRRSSVGVYQTTTRSSGLIGAIPPIRNLNRRKSQSALVGRCVPNVNPIVSANRQVCIEFRLDSTVGGKLTYHSYHFRARLDLAAIFASMTGIDYFTHFRHFCFVVSIQPRLKHHFPQIEEACNRAVNGCSESKKRTGTSIPRRMSDFFLSTLIDHHIREKGTILHSQCHEVPLRLPVVNVEHARSHKFHVV